MMAIALLVMFLVFGLAMFVLLNVLRTERGSPDDLGSFLVARPGAATPTRWSLRERFAKGEIDRKEFRERRRLLSE